MSFFYLSPARGDILYHKLENIVEHRLAYLSSISKQQTSEFSEYVIDGSIYDNVGHFMLTTVAILSQNTALIETVLRGEIALFKKRLYVLGPNELSHFAKKLLGQLKKIDNLPIYLDALYKICRKLMLKAVSQHICGQDHNISCNLHSTPASFKSCLQFISRRMVELKNGIASIPCGLWIPFIILTYKMHLKSRLEMSQSMSILRNDPRIMDIVSKVSRINPNKDICQKTVLLSHNIDKNSIYFPPCMKHLHQTLRARHRLSHDARFQYSLFLKDIGLPIEEALNFWREEYSKNPNGTHICSHTWQKNEKKFVYGIRHLYGLEGGRKGYTSVSCSRIQAVSNTCFEGGCPFKSFDNNTLKQSMYSANIEKNDLESIIELRDKKQYLNACKYYMKTFSIDGQKSNEPSGFFTPVIFYKSVFESMLF